MTAYSRILLIITATVSAAAARAQQSPSFDLREHTWNNGGSPLNGAVPQSPAFRLGLDAIGDPVVAPALSSASYSMDGGFVLAYPPPSEVLNLQFTTKTAFTWDHEKSVGTYNVYRGLVSALPGGFGSCLQVDLPAPGGTDTGTPPPGECFFYLVTAENRLDEEGTKGYQSGGPERPNPTPCP